MTTEYLTTKDVARELNMSEVTVAQWRPRGLGPPFVRVGRTIRYPRVDFDAWLAAHKVGKVQ